jgi:hypothetical protein
MITIDPLIEQALESSYTRAHLVTLELNGVTLRYTENGFDLDYDGNTWLANGLLLDMGEPRYTAELRVNETDLSFTAADLTTLAIILNNPQYNRRVTVDRVYLDDDGDIIGEPIRLNNWRIVGWTSGDEVDGESVIALRMASEFADWQKPSGRRTTQASQQRFYPNDKGLEFAASVNKELRWGGE